MGRLGGCSHDWWHLVGWAGSLLSPNNMEVDAVSAKDKTDRILGRSWKCVIPLS